MDNTKLYLRFLLIGFSSCLAQSNSTTLSNKLFPAGFLFGVASSSYQIEGAWNEDGKGEHIWDKFNHDHPENIVDGSNGDVACDSYHKYKEDVQMLGDLGVNFYRFSISWARILPNGLTNHVNSNGINYYNNLINELVNLDIIPVITIFHWDLPQPLQDVGGWTNPFITDHFVNYARVLFENFGDRVKTWITINEPTQICKLGYGDGVFAPGLNSSGFGDYMCVYNILLAHAKTYRIYDKVYRDKQNGIVGFTSNAFWYEPGSQRPEDLEAAERLFEFHVGIFANPIFGTGDFPELVKYQVANRSTQQGYSFSRLPTFTKDEVNLIRGTFDFYGLNYYSAIMVNHSTSPDLDPVSFDGDAQAVTWKHPSWRGSASTWFNIVPWGLRKVLKKIKETYGDIPIIITENGYGDFGGLFDFTRVNYYLTHLSECLDSIYEDKVKLIGYTAWTLMDNFEWTDGYRTKFGMYEVNFNDTNRARTPKLSSKFYKRIIACKCLPQGTIFDPTEPRNS